MNNAGHIPMVLNNLLDSARREFNLISGPKMS